MGFTMEIEYCVNVLVIISDDWNPLSNRERLRMKSVSNSSPNLNGFEHPNSIQISLRIATQLQSAVKKVSSEFDWIIMHFPMQICMELGCDDGYTLEER